MPFPITISNTLSLAHIVELHRIGRCVIKTPHVGNWYPNNLAIASLGIRMKVCDQTRGERDRNFHPHTVIEGGKQTVVGSATLLMTHAKAQHSAKNMTQGQRIVDGHMGVLHRVIPNLRAELLNTEFLPRNAETVMRIARHLAEHFPTIFERRVLPDGTTVQERFRGVVSLDTYGLFGVTSTVTGWLVPNVMNIIMDGAIDAAGMGEREVFSLSGPDMFVYIGKLQAQLHELYDSLRGAMPELPETMTYHVVRVADMRFAVPERRMTALNVLIAAYLEDRDTSQYWENQIRRVINKEFLIEQKQAARQGTCEALRQAIAGCPEPFYDISHGTFLSQHDLAATGERIVIHPWAMTAPMIEIEKAMTTMLRLRR